MSVDSHSFMSKVWSLLITVIVVAVLVTIAIEAIRLYLPLIGIILIAFGVFAAIRFLIARKR